MMILEDADERLREREVESCWAFILSLSIAKGYEGISRRLTIGNPKVLIGWITFWMSHS